MENKKKSNVTLAPEHCNKIENASELEHDKVTMNLTSNPGTQCEGPE
jgi:hypothetical protein